MIQDLRYAVRVLLQSKGWTAMVVLSLALGIGANTALFSAVNGLALRTLAVAGPQSLVRLLYVGPNEMVTASSGYGTVAPQGGLEVSTQMEQIELRFSQERLFARAYALFGVGAIDTPTLALAMLVMTAVSAFAGYLPARRASRVDPIVALHYE